MLSGGAVARGGRRVVAVLLVLAVAVALWAGPPAAPAASGSTDEARASSASGPPMGGEPTGTFLIGDSTTFRVAAALKAAEPDWLLSYHRGRSIRTLPSHLAAYLRRHPPPANFVMALGTNATHDPNWSEGRLRRAIRMLPASTHVFLLVVVRAGVFQVDKDRLLRRYNRYSRRLVHDRPNTYLVNWRHAVLSDPTLNRITGRSSLLDDGTHETGTPYSDHPGPGQATWIHLIVRRWNSVNRSPGVA